MYSNELPNGAVIETAFELASFDVRRLQEAALVLRRVILDSFKAVITQLCWDNFDVAEETPSGAGTTH